MRKSLTRWTVPLLASLGLLLAACGQKAAAPEPQRAVRTLVAQASETGQTLQFAAEVRARTESRLAFRVPGKVLVRRVGLGDAVKPGQVLMQLDPADLRLAAEAAEAQLRAAKTQRDSQAADMKRFRELHAQGFIGNAELERRDAAYQAAVAQFDQARAHARAQANQADYGTLQADAAGVITAVMAEPGTVLAAGAPVLTLAHDGPRDIVFQVPEQQVARLRERAAGGQLRVTVPGVAEPLKAQLREVAQAADPVTRTFLVKADIGVQPEVRIGQSATLTLASGKVQGVIKLPMSAVFESKGQAHVLTLEPASMTVKLRPVQIGGADGSEVIVVAGLVPGQEVVTAGVHVLRDGEKVRRYGATAAPAAAAASR